MKIDKMKYTTIQISAGTKWQLANRKADGQSYDGLILKMLDKWLKHANYPGPI